MAYKGSGKKNRGKNGIQIGGPSPNLKNFGAPKRKAEGHDSRKVHDSKGKNNHGRNRQYGSGRR